METIVNKLGITQLEADCHSVVEAVMRKKESFLITSQGKPVAKLVPVGQGDAPDLAGSILYESDLVSPTGEDWSAEK